MRTAIATDRNRKSLLGIKETSPHRLRSAREVKRELQERLKRQTGYDVFISYVREPDARLARMVLQASLLGAVLLILAHQRFLQQKSLVLLILSSLLANLIVGFLHGIVPGILVSITDAIAALVVASLAAAWASVMLIGSLIGVSKTLRSLAPA